MLCQEPKLQLKYADKMKKNSLECRVQKRSESKGSRFFLDYCKAVCSVLMFFSIKLK